jgi:acetylornithine aminotransferase/acetylornithine/N-succinyldiaminopimelate aminotransferase
VLIEGIQGEGGIAPATPEYLLGLRALCDEKKLLFMIDGVQCGHFRTGRFQSFQRILENMPSWPRSAPDRASAAAEPAGPARVPGVMPHFLPDAIAMAKSLGGGLPMGAFWVREPYADLLEAGTHGTTFGGTPLACAVALKVLEVIERDRLADSARRTGEFLKSELQRLVDTYPRVLKAVRGMGFILGLELMEKEKIPALAAAEKSAVNQFVNRLHEAGLLAIPSGTQVVRLLPPLNLTPAQAAEGVKIIESVVRGLS